MKMKRKTFSGHMIDKTVTGTDIQTLLNEESQNTTLEPIKHVHKVL